MICTEFAAVLEVNDPRERGRLAVRLQQCGTDPSSLCSATASLLLLCLGQALWRMHTAGKQGMPLAARRKKRRGQWKQREVRRKDGGGGRKPKMGRWEVGNWSSCRETDGATGRQNATILLHPDFHRKDLKAGIAAGEVIFHQSARQESGREPVGQVFTFVLITWTKKNNWGWRMAGKR